MEIEFLPLNATDFPLLLKWLKSEHVCKWWDQDIDWSLPLIEEKYRTYIDGFKLEVGKRKPIWAYIFQSRVIPSKEGMLSQASTGSTYRNVPIGYIQYYNIRDFKRDSPLPNNMPEKSAALDFYIGDPNYLGKGYGSGALKAFCEEIIWPQFEACFVEPDSTNEAAVKCYERAGFEIFCENNHSVYMVKYIV